MSLNVLFSNFGPNTTTFIIPGEIFPPEVKATCHGLSAASGKLGTFVPEYLTCTHKFKRVIFFYTEFNRETDLIFGFVHLIVSLSVFSLKVAISVRLKVIIFVCCLKMMCVCMQLQNTTILVRD